MDFKKRGDSMKTVVLYVSKYGHSKEYAELISKTLDCDIKAFNEFKKSEVEKYDNIIFGSGVYIGKIKKMKKALQLFSKKPVILFACGGSPFVANYIEELKKNNFTKEQLEFHQFFYLPGGMDLSKVKGIMKFFMNMGRKMLEKKKDKTKDEEEFLKGFDNPTHLVEEKHIKELVEFVNAKE